MKLPISNIDTIDMEEAGDGKTFKGRVGSFSDLFGLKGMGCNVVELEPGDKAWPYHLHYGHEELFVILSGAGTIRFDSEEYPVKSGDVIYAPPGEGTAHQIINTSGKLLRYLALSTKENPETCYYPDSGKYASFAWDDKGQQSSIFIAHESSRMPYHDDEEG
ncbi:MAG: cupin domain-containing protein [Pseudomonadota bacterium]